MPAYIPAAKREDWRTPPEVLSIVRRAFDGPITLDPCASPVSVEEMIGGYNMLGPEQGGMDGLEAEWGGHGARVFVNPPFGANGKWVNKCIQQANRGAEIVLLIPARTDTLYWHALSRHAQAACLWRGRIRFVGAKHPAPFPCAFVYWGRDADRFERTFLGLGHVIRLSTPSSVRGRP